MTTASESINAPDATNSPNPTFPLDDETLLDYEEIELSPIRRYYTPDEMAEHNHDTDCWISWLGNVYNLTSLISEHEEGKSFLFTLIEDDEAIALIVAAAGTDISHWFDSDTAEIKTHIHPITKLRVPYTPQGRFVHIPYPEPHSNFRNDFGCPWWKDSQYCIGKLSKKTRRIKIVNTLTKQHHILEVCSEETITEIAQRFLMYNRNAFNYIWKRHGVELDMDKTLEENGIEDESVRLKELDMPETLYISMVHIYFNEHVPFPPKERK